MITLCRHGREYHLFMRKRLRYLSHILRVCQNQLTPHSGNLLTRPLEHRFELLIVRNRQLA